MSQVAFLTASIGLFRPGIAIWSQMDSSGCVASQMDLQHLSIRLDWLFVQMPFLSCRGSIALTNHNLPESKRIVFGQESKGHVCLLTKIRPQCVIHSYHISMSFTKFFNEDTDDGVLPWVGGYSLWLNVCWPHLIQIILECGLSDRISKFSWTPFWPVLRAVIQSLRTHVSTALNCSFAKPSSHLLQRYGDANEPSWVTSCDSP